MKKRPSTPAPDACPCGSGLAFDRCCGLYLNGDAAPDAEALMRSRFTAYAVGNEPYLLATWAPATRPESLALQDGPHLKWLGLTVHESGQDGDRAFVHFTARCKVSGRFSRIEERSRFERIDGRWYYVDGEVSQG